MKIPDNVLAVLSEMSVIGSSVVITGQIDRKLYVKTNEVLEALGGKWNKKAKAHLFPNDLDVAARLDEVMVTGEVTTHKDLGFFATPPDVGEQLIKIADIKPGHMVLEPSAGEGALVNLLPNTVHVVAIEIDEGRARKIATGSRFASYVMLNSDFLTVSKIFEIDRVVMNPPFLKVGLGDHLDHVQHAFGMLNVGGRLASILPMGVEFRTDKRYANFRRWVEKHEHGWNWLPDAAFRASGTDVRTKTLWMRKS